MPKTKRLRGRVRVPAHLRRGAVHVARSTAAVALAATAARTAAAQEPPTAPEAAQLAQMATPAPVVSLVERPEAFSGRLVSTSGELDECIGPGAFTIEGGPEVQGFGDNDLLVLRPRSDAPVPALRTFGLPGVPAAQAGAVLGSCAGFLGGNAPPNQGIFADNAPVRVTGMVGQFAAEAVERELGVELSEEHFAPFEGDPVLVALGFTPLGRGLVPAPVGAPVTAASPAAPAPLSAAPAATLAPDARGVLVDTGIASTYGVGDGFQGNITACGQVFDTNLPSVAHKTLPCGSMLRVEDVETGRSVIVEVTDRGPFTPGRVVDLSMAAYRQIDPSGAPGLRQVRVYLLPPGS